jgi:hypothetical protein
MDEQSIKFKKIPLKFLIEVLIHLEELGAEYVDIIGKNGEFQDVVTISTQVDYMEDDNDNDDDDDNNEEGLSYNDLNDLIK